MSTTAPRSSSSAPADAPQQAAAEAALPPVRFQTEPARYRHWRLRVEGDRARLTLAVEPSAGLRPGYELKLNSYDLGVDIELADALQRLRFESPQVRCLVIDGALDKVFCAGANIMMLRTSEHRWKVNFCKFTNETRVALEELSADSGIASLAACNGTTAGGGYELAMACDRILLVDDRNSAVSLPEVALLAVLPGTGGLTRLVDKRKVRRDRADVFACMGEGLKGRKALDWGLVDALAPLSSWEERVEELAASLAAGQPDKTGREGVPLEPLRVERSEGGLRYEHVIMSVGKGGRVARLELRLPGEAGPATPAEAHAAGSGWWYFKAWRELDDCLCELRLNVPDVNLVQLRVLGDPRVALAADAVFDEAEGVAAQAWFLREVRAFTKRVLKRLDLTAKGFFALADAGTAFAGSFLELALAADRFYVLDDPEEPVTLGVSGLNAGALPMANGLSRLATRFLGQPEKDGELLERAASSGGLIEAAASEELGLATEALDAIDWDDEIRVAVEERAAFSPDALTGLEANLRFAGPETLETKIFGRLTAWQNWIFQRPNAVGPQGALQCYGEPTRPRFDTHRT